MHENKVFIGNLNMYNRFLQAQNFHSIVYVYKNKNYVLNYEPYKY